MRSLRCEFEPTAEPGRYRCRRCGFVLHSPRFGPDRIRRQCDAILLERPSDRGLGDTLARWLRPIARLLGLEECGGCRRRQNWLNRWLPYTPADRLPLDRGTPPAVLLRFPHGLGDCVQLTTVLLHLRQLVPDWQIDVASRPGTQSCFTGLCRAQYVLGQEPPNGYDLTRTLHWYEPHTCYADSPATKAERCLREVFNVQPQPELCRYEVPIEREASHWADTYLRHLDRPAVLVHYQGNSSRARKNLDERAVAALCRTILSLGFVPIILDWDSRSHLRGEGIVRLTRRDPFWSVPAASSAALLAALADRVSACFGIDSGPGHLFGATSTPSVIVWTRHHPLHYYTLAPHVLHLVPWQHKQLLRGETVEQGLAYFQRNYHYRIYRHLESTLCGVARERLTQQAKAGGPGDSNPLLMDGDLWIRPTFRAADMTIVRDVYLEDCYRIAELPRRPRYVVDIGAHIGAFAAAMHRRAARARIVCVEPHAANLPALKANVGRFATIVAAAASYDPEPLWLQSSIFPGSDNTGASRVQTGVPGASAACLESVCLRGHSAEAEPDFPCWQVPGVTLETLMREHGLPRIDLLKLDCEGCELSILRHADLSAVSCIVGEYHDRDDFMALVRQRFRDWNFRLLKDAPIGLFWLWK